MPQMSKIVRSREHWKYKAVQRAYEIREQRKSKKRDQEKITKLQMQLYTMKQINEDKKNATSTCHASCQDR